VRTLFKSVHLPFDDMFTELKKLVKARSEDLKEGKYRKKESYDEAKEEEHPYRGRRQVRL